MNEHPSGAILQRDKRTYAIVPRTPVGLVTPDDLEKIAAVARKFKIPVIKITSGQRFALVGIERDAIDAVWQELGMDVGKATELCLHYVQACPGTDVCQFGLQDSLGLGKKIEEFFIGMDLPAKRELRARHWGVWEEARLEPGGRWKLGAAAAHRRPDA